MRPSTAPTPTPSARPPADVVETARLAAEKDGREGWKLTLHMPCYLPVMQYADYHPLRERMYRAFVTRASEFGRPEWDNTPLIAAILDKRAEVASLLGFGTYAGVSLATKMAGSPGEVIAFLEDLAARARPFAERDMAEVVEFARRELNLAEVRACDVAWVSEKLRQARYAFSDLEVKRYFPEEAVLGGLFRVIETLYGVRIVPAAAKRWRANVDTWFEIDPGFTPYSGSLYAATNDASGRLRSARTVTAGMASAVTPADGITVVTSSAPPDGAIRRVWLAACGIESGSAPTGIGSA